jgi:endonuclease YncB( thermonuclease family)
MRGDGGSWRVRALTGVIVAAVAAPAHAADRGRCQPTAIGTAVVQAALDGRTLRLLDGRELRLIGVEVPDRQGAAQAANAALAAMVEGRDVRLARLDEETDRHGRLLALVFLTAAGSDASVQRALIAQGHARVAARVGDRACALHLLEAERAARAAKLGLWADPHYVIKQAGNPDEILSGRGTFSVVAGHVLSVRESGGTIYINFGRRWSEDFTATIAKRNERMFAAAGLVLKDLAGRHVRVRGFVEERGGPWIEAARPEQIEIAERD